MNTWLGKAACLVESVIHPVSQVAIRMALGVLAVMMFLTVLDVCLRYLFNRPLPGTYEITEFMMVVTVFFAVAYTQIQKGHVRVELLVSRLPPKAQAVIDSSVSFLSLGLLSLITWQSFIMAKAQMANELTSTILRVPVFPFVLVVVFGCGLLSLVLLENFLSSLTRRRC